LKTILLALIGLLVACDVGTFGPDGAGGGDDTVCAQRATQIAPIHTHANPIVGGDPANSKATGGCIQANCHGTPLGAGAIPKDFAGTLYKPDGVTPQAGATVRVKNANNMIQGVTTDAGGNFFIDQGGLSSPFPSNTSATVCPQLVPMQGQLTVGSGNCNGGGACHGQGGTVVMTLSDML
jgi:hypothetical protein